MTLQAGRVDTRNTADVSVMVSAGNDVSITAVGGLSVIGGTAVASTTDANFGSATATANATLNAGRDMTVTIASGNLLVQGGNATAVASASSVFYQASGFANANATISATRNLTVNSVGSNLSVVGGIAAASVPTNGTSFSPGCDICTAVASANGIMTAGSVTVSNVTGNLSLTAGNAQAGVNGVIGSTGDRGVASASANASISASTLNTTLNATGLVSLIAGTALVNGSWPGSSGPNSVDSHAKANAALSAANNLVVTAGTGLALTGGNATATPTFGLGTGSATATAKANVTAGNNATLNVLAGSFVANIGATNASSASFPDVITADASALINAVAGLSITASNNITGHSAELSGAGVLVRATNNINLFSTITTVGNGTAPGVSGDSLLLDIMDKVGIGLPANNNPNAMFEAGGSLDVGDVNLSATNGYLWFSADHLTVGNISTQGGALLVQYSPFTPTLGIVFEDQSPFVGRGGSVQARHGLVEYDNSNHVSPIPMTTVAIGSAQQSGPITVGANGVIDIGARNIIFLTTPDDVNSRANVITTGIVAGSGFVGTVREEVFVTPRLENFTVEVESWWLEAERRKQQLIEEGASNNGMCIAL